MIFLKLDCDWSISYGLRLRLYCRTGLLQSLTFRLRLRYRRTAFTITLFEMIISRILFILMLNELSQSIIYYGMQYASRQCAFHRRAFRDKEWQYGCMVGIGFDTSGNTGLAIVSRAQQRISRYATCIRYYNLTRGGMRRSFDKRKRERGNGR